MLPDGDRNGTIVTSITTSDEIILYLLKSIKLTILEWPMISLMLTFLFKATTGVAEDKTRRSSSSCIRSQRLYTFTNPLYF